MNLSGGKRGWAARKHHANVRAKMELGLARPDRIYRIPSSPLRTSQRILPVKRSHTGTEVEITRWAEEDITDMIPFDHFKLSSYSVLNLPRKSRLQKYYKAKNVVMEIVSFFDSKTFWSKLPYQGKTRLPLKLLPKPFAATSLPVGKMSVDSAASDDFPVIRNKRKGHSRSRSLQPYQGGRMPTASPKTTEASLQVKTLLLCQKGRGELDGNWQTLLNLFKKPKEEVKRSLSRIPAPSKPFLEERASILPHSLAHKKNSNAPTISAQVSRYHIRLFTRRIRQPVCFALSSTPKQTTKPFLPQDSHAEI